MRINLCRCPSLLYLHLDYFPKKGPSLHSQCGRKSPTLNKENIADGNILHLQSSALLGRSSTPLEEVIVGKVDSHRPSSTPLWGGNRGRKFQASPLPATLLKEKIVGKVRHPQSSTLLKEKIVRRGRTLHHNPLLSKRRILSQGDLPPSTLLNKRT